MQGYFKTDLLLGRNGKPQLFPSKEEATLYLLQQGVPFEDVQLLTFVEEKGGI